MPDPGGHHVVFRQQWVRVRAQHLRIHDLQDAAAGGQVPCPLWPMLLRQRHRLCTSGCRNHQRRHVYRVPGTAIRRRQHAPAA